MISIELWRAKIGLFNCRRSCSRVFRLPSSSNLFAGDYRIPSLWSLGLSSSSLLKRRALVLLLVVVISHLLLSSGDVEQNPGPSKDDEPEMHQLQCMTYTNKDGNDVDFRLVDRIQPKWTRLAIALRFPMYKVQTFESKADPVINLLGEWLQRGNKEDTRPVTWATLIEALHDADLKEEADIIVKQVMTQTAHKTQSGKRFQNADGRGSELGSDLVQLTEGYTISHGPIKVIVKPDISNRLQFLVCKYAEMLQMLRETKLLKSKFCKLKYFLSDYCDLTEGSIQKCSTVSGIVDVLKRKSKIFIFNIDVLNDTCKFFLGFEVKRSVRQYKQHLDKFLSSTIVKDFQDALECQIDSSSDWESERVILKLDKRRSDDNLKVLKRLVYDIFGISSKALIHCRTGAGCVCVTLLAPTTLVPTLRMKAEQHSHEYLASQGVLELVIGLRVAPNEVNIEELQLKIDSYQRMGRARDLAISNLQKRNEKLESELEIVHTDTKTYQEKVAAKDEEFKILYNRMCAFREKCGELEKVVTAVRRENLDLADNYTVLERENKMLRKQKFDLEEKHEVVKRDVEIFEQKPKERELMSLQKQKFDQEEKLGDLEREVEIFEQKEKDSPKVGVASVVQDNVQYHTTDKGCNQDIKAGGQNAHGKEND